MREKKTGQDTQGRKSQALRIEYILPVSVLGVVRNIQFQKKKNLRQSKNLRLVTQVSWLLRKI